MLRNRLYYAVKPLVPYGLRMAVRRRLAFWQRKRAPATWPIMPGSEQPPQGWPGWPEGKQFALVLTHDIEGASGLAKCRQLMELEQRLDFRAAFYFSPENSYSAPELLREEVRNMGFEVGVHDLYHDGKLFNTRAGFRRKAARINQHLKRWDAIGFRAGFMLHKLDWLHELNIQYDASTFDTDPFEPQPDGQHTIFPFWVPSPRSTSNPRPSPLGHGYVELPYTLPQDSTLFLLLQERQPDIWIQKLDWIAKHGGMALINVHPDYMRFDSEPYSAWTYPAEFYEGFLKHIRSRYSGAYWQALPRQVAEYVRNIRSKNCAASPATRVEILVRRKAKPKIWVDLDNTPHVPFFEPILEELQKRGFPVLVTARDAFQVCALADKKHLPYVRIGRHYGKNRLFKAAGLAWRALQLAPIVLREKPVLGVSHGARSQLLLGNLLRIPTVLIEDYEYCQFPPMMKPAWLMAPAVIPNEALCLKNGKVRKYPGIKEDVYAWKLNPNPEFLRELRVPELDLVVTVRPPATEAHYHNPESEKLFIEFMERASRAPQTSIVLLPRNQRQAEWVRQRWPHWFSKGKTIIPPKALDGMDLIWHSDLVVSGGGTMNREAAALGVPVYSIFRGTIGAVDKQLAREGRLKLVTSLEEVESIPLVKRVRKPIAEATSRRTLLHIVDAIVEIAESLDAEIKTGI